MISRTLLITFLFIFNFINDKKNFKEMKTLFSKNIELFNHLVNQYSCSTFHLQFKNTNNTLSAIYFLLLLCPNERDNFLLYRMCLGTIRVHVFFKDYTKKT